MMCNGNFLSKDPEEAMDFYEQLSENAQSWEISDPYDRSRGTYSSGPTSTAKAHLGEIDELQEKLAHLTTKLDLLEKRSTRCKLRQ